MKRDHIRHIHVPTGLITATPGTTRGTRQGVNPGRRKNGARAMATEKNAHHGSRRLYSALEAATLLGVGRTYMFHLIATRQIESVKIGKLRKVPSDALDEYIDRLRAEQ